MKKTKSFFDDPLFKMEDDRLEAQLEYMRERSRKQEIFTGGY
jgi:hypothetical protein